MVATSEGWKGEPRSSHVLQQARVQLAWPQQRDFRILSIDGGGIKGIFAAALLARLEVAQLGGRNVGRFFDLITGTSTGGIIAIALAQGISAQAVLDIYLSRGGEIFPRRRAYGILRSAFPQRKLAEELQKLFGETLIGDASTRLCIPSADGHHGDVAVFKTPHHPNYGRDWMMSCVDAGLATSAAPTFLPVHSAGGYRFVDGGVWANNPVMVGLVDALACYKIERRSVRILSIGNGYRKPILGAGQLCLGGAVGWMWGGVLIDSMLYYPSLNSDGQAGLLIGRDRLLRLEPESQEAQNVQMTDYKAAMRLLPSSANTVADGLDVGILEKFLSVEADPAQFFHGPRAAT